MPKLIFISIFLASCGSEWPESNCQETLQDLIDTDTDGYEPFVIEAYYEGMVINNLDRPVASYYCSSFSITPSYPDIRIIYSKDELNQVSAMKKGTRYINVQGRFLGIDKYGLYAVSEKHFVENGD